MNETSPRVKSNSNFIRWLIENEEGRGQYTVKCMQGGVIVLVSLTDVTVERRVEQSEVDKETWAWLCEQLPAYDLTDTAGVTERLLTEIVPAEKLDLRGISPLRKLLHEWVREADEVSSTASSALNRNAEANAGCHGGKGSRETKQHGEKNTKKDSLITNTANTSHLTLVCGRRTLREHMEEQKTDMEREHEGALLAPPPAQKKKLEKVGKFHI